METFNVKEHYDNHLSNFYSWMAGNFDQERIVFQNFLESHSIRPASSKVAIDLGAGHGIQSIALKNMGFDVTAIDFNDKLLNELKANLDSQSIKVVKDDIRNIGSFSDLKPEVIVCCGDTITHLESKTEIKNLIKKCSDILSDKGKLILSFRDYSHELNDKQRFIPVKNDDDRILTCILEYESERIKVTDLLYEKTKNGWNPKVSSYFKVRIKPNEVVDYINNHGLTLTFNEPFNRMYTIIAEKKNGLQQ